MPIQRGKRRKRPRRRGRADGYEPLGEPQTRQADAPGTRTTLFGRPRRDMPPWLNITVGVFLLVLGFLFSLSSPKGFAGWEYAIILIGYLGLAGYYLSKGFRQYRDRRQS